MASRSLALYLTHPGTFIICPALHQLLKGRHLSKLQIVWPEAVQHNQTQIGSYSFTFVGQSCFTTREHLDRCRTKATGRQSCQELTSRNAPARKETLQSLPLGIWGQPSFLINRF